MKQDDTTARFDEKQLAAYFSGTATPEEEQALLAWIRSSDDNRRTFAELRAVWQRGRMQRPDTQLQARFVRSLNSLNRRIDALGADAPLRRGRRIPLRRFAAAAVIVVALAAAFMTYRVATAPFVHRFHNADTVAMHVAMPDGTDVWLSPGTTLSYDDTFRIDGRNVALDGEAYFEVEHDARRPFVVVTGQVVSTVLGTTFNVHAYSEDENYQITLATGSLLVDGGRESRSVRLRPGEQGFFERTSGMLSLRRVNVDHVLSWQEDKLYFRAEPLASIAQPLERQFNVDIVIADERLRKICFTGEFVDGENIHEIMRIISADSRILYRNRKNRFELYRNR